jgi:SPP1 gp7 family putative phage head morphogenesis protein
MPSANEIIRDLELRHHVGVQRIGSANLKAMLKLLADADKDIVQIIRDREVGQMAAFTTDRYRGMLGAIRSIIDAARVAMGERLSSRLRALAAYESQFQRELLNHAVGVRLETVTPPLSVLEALVTQKPFDGFTLPEWMEKLSASKYDAVKGAIQRGMVEGKTTDQIVRDIRGTKSQNFKDGIIKRGQTSVERLVRTATNHVSNSSREEFFKRNKNIVKGMQWVATLDTRTCKRCAALDGKVYPIGAKKKPGMPLHINCRCTWTPVTKSFAELGFKVEEFDAGQRQAMDGLVSETETYNTWLRRQSAAVQDEALGKTRGALFRRGGLSVDRFVDVKGHEIPLDELSRIEAHAFRKAGV